MSDNITGLAHNQMRRNNVANTPGCVGSLRASRGRSPGESSGRAGGVARGGGQQQAGGSLDGPFAL